MIVRMQQRRGTASEWANVNPVLSEGEMGYEEDTRRIKFGNGTSPWTSLFYVDQGQIGPPGVADDASMSAIAQDPGSEFHGVIVTQVADIAGNIIPDMVADAIALDPTIVAAAVAAVDEALDDAGIMHGVDVGDSFGDEVFTIVDEENKKSWLAIGLDGGPPARVKDIIRAIQGDAAGWTVTSIEGVGNAFSITDSEDHRAFYITEAGAVGWENVDAATAERFIATLSDAGYSLSALVYSDFKNVEHKTASGPNIICYGDSLTAGAGGGTVPASGVVTTAWTFPSRVQALVDARLGAGVSTVFNAGVGGESSVSITARTNANPLMVVVSSGTLGAVTTSQTITFAPINGEQAYPLLQGDGGGSTGHLWIDGAPIAGTIQNTGGGTYAFARATAGSAIVVGARPVAFTYNFANTHSDDIHIIAMGQNGPSNARTINDVAAVVQKMTALNKRFLIVNRPTSTDGEDALWHDLYGRRFFSLRKYMVTWGLADTGITPTTQDNTDMTNGAVPTSLRIDGVHGNAAYYWAWGNQVFNRLVELGWI